MKTPFYIVVLISGRGSNLKSLIDHAKNYRIRAVISNNPDAPGLKYTENTGIETFSFSRNQAGSLIAHKQAIYSRIDRINPSLIVLAGFMQILERDFVERNEGRIVNIHPSLLPGLKGLNTHKRALERFHHSNRQQREHGCTVHFVEYTIDAGPIIAQSECPILAGDSEESLSARVLEQEHRLLPWVVNEIADQNIQYQNGGVKFQNTILIEAKKRGFTLFHS